MSRHTLYGGMQQAGPSWAARLRHGRSQQMRASVGSPATGHHWGSGQHALMDVPGKVVQLVLQQVSWGGVVGG